MPAGVAMQSLRVGECPRGAPILWENNFRALATGPLREATRLMGAEAGG
jgi:hypothetical protein